MVPKNLTTAVFRGCDFSGYTEAYAAGAVYSSKTTITEAMLNLEGFADAVIQALIATEKAINNGQSDMEVVLVDVDNPDRVWAHLHDYMHFGYTTRSDLDINGAEREPTQVNKAPAPASTMSAVDLEVLLQASYGSVDAFKELSPAKQTSFRKLFLMDLVLPRGEGLTPLGETYVKSLKALPIVPRQPKSDTSVTGTGTLPHPFCDPRFKRAWVNQPSTSQPWHQHHGQKVLVVDTGEASVDVYFTEGPVISGIAPRNALSIGSWPAPKPETLVTGTGHVVKTFQSNEDHFIAIDTNSQSVEAKGNAKEVLDTLSENYGAKQIREDIEIYELGRKCKLKIFLTPGEGLTTWK